MFMLAICFVYLLMYLDTPWAMLRSAGQNIGDGKNWTEFLGEEFECFTDNITGREAWLQVCLIPLVLLFGIAGMGMVLHFSI